MDESEGKAPANHLIPDKTARDQAEKLLRRWRPAALDAATNGEGEAKKEEQ